MKAYQNPESGATHYDIHHGEDGIEGVSIRFKNGTVYSYTWESCGDMLFELGLLAKEGKGICRYIAKNKPPYAHKETDVKVEDL